MIGRLTGLLLIVRTLALPLLVVFVVVNVQMILADINQRTLDRRTALENHLLDLEREVYDLAGSVGGVQRNISASFENLASVADAIDFNSLPIPQFSIPTEIDLSLPGTNILPNIGIPGTSINLRNVLTLTDVPIPFAAALNSIPNQVREGLRRFRQPFDTLITVSQSLDSAFDSLQQAKDETVQLYNELDALLNSAKAWGPTIQTILGLILLFFVLWYVSSALDDLQRGWRLLRGE
ncbi:MAG: hypothetical protein K8L99_33155 [Anaerolineae bacterium]|nr:hypothetical protein [Anaerolineae bacterium]